MARTFTLNDLKAVYQQLIYLKSDIYLQNKIDLLKDRLERYCQILVWGDKHNPEIFEFFWEMKSLSLFFDLFVRCKSKQLNILSVDYLCKLLINISDQHSLHLMLSNPMIANMQTIRFVSMPLELAEYYINFLKTLALKINETTIHLFFNQKYPMFPLAWQAIRFINHPESLIRTTCNNIFPPIMRLRDARLIEYLTRFPFVVYYSHLACLIKEHWLSIDSLLKADEKDSSTLNQTLDDLTDLYTYFEQMVEISAEKVSMAYLNGFIWECVSPLIKTLSEHSAPVSVKTALYVVGLIYRLGENKQMADLVTFLLLGRYSNILMLKHLVEAQQISSYSRMWSFKTYWDDCDTAVQEACLELFDKKPSLNTSTKLLYTPQTNKVSQASGDTSPPTRSHIRTPQSERQLSTSLISLFGSETTKYDSELQKLSKAYGLFHNKAKHISLLEQFIVIDRDLCSNKLADMKQFVDNRIKDVLYSCLSSESDTIVSLVLQIMMGVTRPNRVSRHILLFAGLADRSELYSRVTQERIVRSCLEMFRKHHIFRACTLKASSQLIRRIVSLDKERLSIDTLKVLCDIYQHALQKIKTAYLYSGKQWERVVAAHDRAVQAITVAHGKSQAVLGQSQPTKTEGVNGQSESTHDFLVFLILKALRYELLPSKYPATEIANPLKNSGLQHSIQLQVGNEIRTSQVFDLIECHYKELAEQKYVSGWMLPRKGSFVLLQKLHHSHGQPQGVVRFNLNCKDMMCVTDKSDPRKLIVSLGGHARINVSLMLKDSKIAFNTKSKLQEVRLETLRHQFTHILQSAERCSQDMPVFK